MNNAVLQTIDWSNSYEEELTKDSLCRLFRCNLPYIRIENFASPEECEQLVGSATQEGFSSYRGVEPVINRIGNTVFEYNSVSKGEYFSKNRELIEVQNKIFSNSFNPLDRFMETLRERTGHDVEIPTNFNDDPYYAGLIRRIEKGTLLHVDYAPGEQPGWEIANISEQLVWNLYLRVSDNNTGVTHIFDRKWERADDAEKEGIYGYNRRVVKNAQEVSFEPSVGDVVIFNTRNYHYVEPTKGERVAFTSAIGRTRNDDLVLWS